MVANNAIKIRIREIRDKKPDVKHPEMVDHGINELVRESISTGWGIEVTDGRQISG